MKNVFLLITLFTIACSGPVDYSLTDNDKMQLEKLHGNYRNFWLENDSAKVVRLFAEDGAIIPPNNKNGFQIGKKAIGSWWFTKNGDTTYPITSFVYKNDTLTASGELATWEGVSEVGWNTVVNDSVLSVHHAASNFITVCKKENGEWKIYRQIWNAKPKK
jgi:ketosteroid isomerase-like protein